MPRQLSEKRDLLENFYLLGNLERQIGAVVDYTDNQRDHESLSNATPADMNFRRDNAVLRKTEKSKVRSMTIRHHGLQHQSQAA